MRQRAASSPLVFCAAAPQDALLLTQWEKHLLPLQQAKYLTIWSDQHLLGGDRREEINKYLVQADFIILLLSSDFFASEECLTLMECALERHSSGQARVIPLLLRPVSWSESPLASFSCLPSNSRPVTKWRNRDKAFQVCVDGMRSFLGLPADTVPTRRHRATITVDQQNRMRMLERLRHIYSDILAQSLQGVSWVELGLTSHPSTVQNAVTLLLRLPHHVEQLLPAGTSIVQVYEQATHELLILGEPGAGKSTLLIQLALHLVAQAELDETRPLPIILPLSTWAEKQLPLQDWLVEQVAQFYDIHEKIVHRWMQDDRFLLLLDGLDEMQTINQPKCIVAINAYHHEHPGPIVVCSRKSEYTRSSKRQRLNLQSAVVVQPLSREQVTAFLTQAGKPLDALRTMLAKNVNLWDLMSTPLMLNIFILTYHGTSVRSLSQKGAVLQQQVWTDYVQRMVGQKGNTEHYPLDRTQIWLHWLALQMRVHNQTIFYLEWLQPTWLPKQYQSSYSWSIGLIFGLLTQLVMWLLYWILVVEVMNKLAPMLTIGPALWMGGYALGIGMFTIGFITASEERRMKIKPAEALIWSWRIVRFSFVTGLVFWLGGFLLFGSFFGWVNGVIAGLGMGLLAQLGSVMGEGFAEQQLIERIHLSPNEGIRRSAKNGLIILFVGSLVGGLALAAFFRLVIPHLLPNAITLPPTAWWRIGLSGALIFALDLARSKGLRAVVQHFTLRFHLWRSHTFPWRVDQFLDDAVARALLRRVGGGYSFTHRSLMDYFADLNVELTQPMPITSPVTNKLVSDQD